MPMIASQLRDNYDRHIHYLRLSITDRCDFRCLYCMAEEMTFLPRSEVLSLEELSRLGQAFVDLGVKKIRVTGGEPLVRKDALHLLQNLGAIVGLDELCLTTNGAQLENFSPRLVAAGVKRINVSLDSLDPQRFKHITRHGDLRKVLRGIDAALTAGFEKIKINTVVMRHFNLDEAGRLARFALERGMDISFIEEMPLGDIKSHARAAEFISSEEIRELLGREFHLRESPYRTGGPSRYWEAEGHRGKIGFISPHSDNFCAACNRVRVTAAGRLLLCLGNEHSVDLKRTLRTYESDNELKHAIVQAMNIKPQQHEFDLHGAPQILRFMNTTGG